VPRLAIDAHRLAPGAAEALAYCRTEGGRVAGRYRHVLIVEAGPRWLAVQERTAAVSPFSLVLAQAPSAWPADGARVQANRTHLDIGALTVRLAESEDGAWPTALSAVRAGPDYGWAGPILAPFVAASAFGSEARTGLSRLVRQRGAAALADLARSIAQPELEAAADRLCGLGVGATPSGDDALVGFLGAWLRLAPMADRQPARRLAACLAESAPERTSRLAAEFYFHLARERLSEPIERVLVALATGDGESLASAAAELASFGASSGCDTLAGIDAYLRRASRP
jgi:hypothetical protein